MRLGGEATRNTRIGAGAPGRLRPRCCGRRLCRDGLLLVAAGDVDAAGLGRFVDRDGQGQHAGGLVRRYLFGVEGLAEEDLTGEGAVGPFGDDHLSPVISGWDAFGADGQYVLLDGQVDGPRIDTGQVEVDIEAVTSPVGVHGHRGGPGGGAEHLLSEPVQFAERVRAHEHDGGCFARSVYVTLTAFR